MSDKNAVIIFGATGTVGRQMLDYIVGQNVMGDNVKVVAIGTDEKGCKELGEAYKERVTTAVCDAKDIKQVEKVLGQYKEEGLIGLVNLIGDYTYAQMDALEGDDVMKMMQDNLLTAFNILKVACPMLADQGGGNVACVGAAVVHYGMKHHEAWAAAKGAVEAMHRSAAATWAQPNSRPCHCCCRHCRHCCHAAMHRSGAATWASKNVRINCVAAVDSPTAATAAAAAVTAAATAATAAMMNDAAMHRSAAATWASKHVRINCVAAVDSPTAATAAATAATAAMMNDAAMHRSAAATWASKNVRINCVAAGLMEGPSSGEVSQDPALAKASAELYPLKRLATPEDIAWAVCWLTHPKTLFTTGVALPVDGGISSIQTTGLAMAAAAVKE